MRSLVSALTVGSGSNELKLKKIYESRQQGVSPVVATMVLVAVALVTAVSLGGFVTGLFGSFTATQSVNNSLLFAAGGTPVLTFSTSNSGSATNITLVSLSGVGVTGVYMWTPDAAWQFSNPLDTGGSLFTLTDTTTPTFAPTGTVITGNAYSLVINLANGRALTAAIIAN